MIEAAVCPAGFLEEFARLEPFLREVGTAATHALRQEGANRFAELDWPTTKHEEWKYTSVRPIAETVFRNAQFETPVLPPGVVEAYLFDADATRLLLVNGCHAGCYPKAAPEGVALGPLSEALRVGDEEILRHLGTCSGLPSDAFASLNAAFLAEGAVVRIGPGRVVEGPLYVLHFCGLGEPVAAHPRNLFIVGANSQATVIEVYVGLDGPPSLTNAVTEVFLGDGAVLRHAKLQLGSEDAFHVSRLEARLGRSSSLQTTNVTLGGAVVRNDTGAVLDGEGAEATLYGLYVARGRQHIDNHTRLEHAQPHCNSFELYKGILDGRASGVFNGKIVVNKDAQKTDSKQSNMNLLLSDDASIDTKPQLEIFADDVRCTHGATVGRLDENAVFYLRTRGIDLETAERLLTYAFASEVLDKLPTEALTQRLEGQLFERFAQPQDLGDGESDD